MSVTDGIKSIIHTKPITYDYAETRTDADLTKLTDEQYEALSKKYWLRSKVKDGDKWKVDKVKSVFLAENVAEQSAIESDLNNVSVTFVKKTVALTSEQKSDLEKAQVNTRKESEFTAAFNRGTKLRAIDSASDLATLKQLMKDLL